MYLSFKNYCKRKREKLIVNVDLIVFPRFIKTDKDITDIRIKIK